jgi:hypothetical protein
MKSLVGCATNNDPVYKLETPKALSINILGRWVKHQFFVEENLALQFEQAQEDS